MGILRKARDIVGTIQLPSDILSIWQAIRKHVFPWAVNALIGLVGWWSDASYLEIAGAIIVASIVTYLVVFLLAALWRRGAFDRRTTQSETQEKRKAVRELLGDALEQGQHLQKGMYLHGERLRDANQEDVEKWVDRTHDFIQDAFGKLEAQHFLSREGYSDEELLGSVVHKKYYKRFPPRFLNDKYFVKARVKRLQELCLGNLPEIKPDFNPEDYPSDWFRR